MRQSIGLGVLYTVPRRRLFHSPAPALVSRSRTGVCFAATLGMAVALLGCGGGGSPGASAASQDSSAGGEQTVPNAPVHKTGGKSVTAVIGPPGGSLELSSGAKIEIPAGAIEDKQTFVLEEAPGTTAFFNSEHERPVGPIFVISPGVNAPDGSTVQVSIPLASYPQGWGDVSLAYEYPVGEVVGGEDSEHTRWQYTDAKLSGGRAVAEVPGLNGYRLQFVLSNLEAQ